MNQPSQMRGPGVTIEALTYILGFEKTHGIHFVGFGLDTFSIDNGRSISRPSLGLASKLGKYIVLNMKDLKAICYIVRFLSFVLQRLPPKGAKIIVMPMKIKDGEAAPTRVAARIPYN
ncbi:hypothetical protein Avbf_18065 [Armadillidium vulgare]|nr:hypothetical protein Avbf_18065 [Armadillidium vulgare]